MFCREDRVIIFITPVEQYRTLSKKSSSKILKHMVETNQLKTRLVERMPEIP